jgi:hypothetical protein
VYPPHAWHPPGQAHQIDPNCAADRAYLVNAQRQTEARRRSDETQSMSIETYQRRREERAVAEQRAADQLAAHERETRRRELEHTRARSRRTMLLLDIGQQSTAMASDDRGRCAAPGRG